MNNIDAPPPTQRHCPPPILAPSYLFISLLLQTRLFPAHRVKKRVARETKPLVSDLLCRDNSRTHASQTARPEATSPPCATRIAALVWPVQVLDAPVRAGGGGVPAGGEKGLSVVVVHVHVVCCGRRGPLPETTRSLQVAGCSAALGP
jgi:hypothetical protein